ncbi:MAG: hypothetical protein ACTSYB_01600 [Candidatus Helarchaeota archaeon]
MSYKMPKITDKRKLCPRCGSPLLSVGKVLKCPLCGYTQMQEGEAPKVTIRYTEPEVLKKEEPTIKIFQVLPSGVSPAPTLESDNVYLIADHAQNTIWLWKGSRARPRDVYNAGTAATKLKTSEKMYSAKLVHVEEGDEPPEFPEVAGKSIIREEMVSEAKEAIVIKPPPEGQHNIYLINKGELEKIDKPVFTTGDSYLIDAGDKIWVWIGQNATVDEKFSAAHLSTVIDVSRRGKPKITTVEQGKEPNELRVLLGGLKIVDKDVAESLLKPVEKEVWEPVLYRISSEEYESIDDIVYVQVPCTKESLDSEDVFLLDDRTNNRTYIWIGSKANVKEKVKGGQIARKFEAERAGVQQEIFIDEGEEPEEFRRLLKFPD